MDTMFDLDRLEAAVGAVARREFTSAGEHHRVELYEWAFTLAEMSEGELRDAAEDAIYSSALVNSWRGNWDHLHFRCSAAYHECTRRDAASGRDSCLRHGLYSLAHRRVMADSGYPQPLPECACR